MLKIYSIIEIQLTYGYEILFRNHYLIRLSARS